MAHITDHASRTIHGMVYNAMKLFMEINPQLFDDCSHDYTEQQNSAAEREALRERKWAALSEKADQRRASLGNSVGEVPPVPRGALCRALMKSIRQPRTTKRGSIL